MNRFVMYSVAAAALLAACGGTSDKVDLALSALTFQEGHSEPLVIKAVQNGKTVDVTAQAKVTVTGTAVTIDDQHVLHAVMPGSATINVTYQALTGSSKVTVSETALKSIEVQVADGAALKVGATVQLVALGTHEGGNVRPAAGATFGADDTRVADVNPTTGETHILAGGPVQITAHVGDLVSPPLSTKATCDYPHGPPNFSAPPIEGRIMPELVFKHARKPDGTLLHDFDLNDVYCNADWKDTKVLIMYVGAGWCYPCTLFAQSLADQAHDLTAAGAQVIMIEAQRDNEAQPVVSDAEYGWEHISDITMHPAQHGDGKPGGIVTGDAEIASPAGQPCNSPVTGDNCYFNNQNAYLTQFPSVFVVRTRDMRIIADQRTTYLPLLDIAHNPEADWAGNGGSNFVDNCEKADDAAHEPDDHTTDAAATTAVAVGTTVNAGICKDNDTDIFSVNVSGQWTAKIDFVNAIGNLDLYLWDKAKNQPLEVNGQIIASTSNDNSETISYAGPAEIAVQGFSHNSASYTLTVTSP